MSSVLLSEAGKSAQTSAELGLDEDLPLDLAACRRPRMGGDGPVDPFALDVQQLGIVNGRHGGAVWHTLKARGLSKKVATETKPKALGVFAMNANPNRISEFTFDGVTPSVTDKFVDE